MQRAGVALRNATRHEDIVARVGGDEFAILAVECDRPGAEALLQRVQDCLHEHDVHASVGLAVREYGSSLDEACNRADLKMYEQKALGKAKLHSFYRARGGGVARPLVIKQATPLTIPSATRSVSSVSNR